MTTIKFYGRPITATQRNSKLLMFGFFPAVMVLSYTVLFLGAWALADFLGIGLWITLPAMIALCLDFTFNTRTVALLPKSVQGPLHNAITALALYVFWKDHAMVKFSVVALFVVHNVAHKLLALHWDRKEKKEAELARLGQGLTGIGYGQRIGEDDSKV